ncbi:EamA family transporter [Clostridium frigidicarnis]|uniref:Uncharacterized membrane protein n=1 Tax=Clostridium frigidicarnis TaxID=84698 RepID=A0A1I1ADC3_9CLOT|nr:EamA family transporter [Clostridium frigidicarnis]SFB35977.1 Uncharacterized membrane protein [Clostridium frigidicarnis]
MVYILLTINIILLVLGQTLWKIGVKKVSMELSIKGLIEIMKNPYILGGLFIYGFATIIWLYILSKEELSMVYPIQSLCYVLTLLIAIILFKESIPLTRWVGVGFIVLGAFFVSIK